MRFAQQAGGRQAVGFRPAHAAGAPGLRAEPKKRIIVQVEGAERIDAAGVNRDIQDMIAFWQEP